MGVIYCYTNKINNKSYIGRTENIHKRWLRHISELNSNKHHCLHLQRAWNKYGKDNFTFSIIQSICLGLLSYTIAFLEPTMVKL